ncbi:MAG: NAD(P)H-hydrate epimerase, partial [Thermoplasmata archaeon]|nr:NAD(P)H-hydrate epimerase [Thermoplasmata archaeon]
MLSPVEVKVLDRNAEYWGVAVESLMDNAGSSLAEVVLERGGRGANVLIFCGPGNNGGDGMTAAHYLRKKCNVRVVLLHPPERIKTPLARRAYERVHDLCKVVGGADDIVADIAWSDIIVDAMLGVGLKGSLRDPYETV